MSSISVQTTQGMLSVAEAKNYISDSSAQNWKTQPSRGSQINDIARAINFLAARMPKICFSASADPTALETDGSAPLFQFTHLDDAVNAKTRRHTVLALPRVSGTGDGYAIQYGGTDQTIAITQDPVSSVTHPEDLFIQTFDVDVSADAVAVVEDGLSTVQGYTVVDYLVQDLPEDTLDSTTDTGIVVPIAAAGQEILSEAETIRAALYALRQVNLPMSIRWCAQIPSGGYATPASSDTTAFVCDSASYGSFANIFDSSVTARSATSPGISAYRYKCGRGDKTTAAGRKVAQVCRVLAQSTTTDASIKFIGPTGISSNNTTITVTGGGGVDFYGSDSNIFYFDSAIDVPTDATRNKVDIHAECTSGTLYIYGLYAWEVYV